MGTPQHEPMRSLTDQEQAALHRVAKANSARADRARRATALLAVASG